MWKRPLIAFVAFLAISFVGLACRSDTVLAADPFPGVLPRPKQYFEAREPLRLVSANEPLTITIYGQDPLLQVAAEELMQRVASLGGTARTVERDGQVRIGVKSDWPTDIALTVSAPAHEQGYGLLVTAGDESGMPRVSIIGSDALGTYFGVQTLIQLLSTNSGGEIRVRHVKIADWPSFLRRGFKSQCWQYRDNRMFVDWAPRFKFTFFGSCYTDSIDWRNPPDAYQSMLQDICETARSGKVQVVQLGNPYMNRDRPISASSQADLNSLISFFEQSLSRGSREIMLCLDDFAVLSEQDRDQFPTLASANIRIVTQLHAALVQRYPEMTLLVCPPPYWLHANQRDEYAWAHDYLREFSAGIPGDVIIVWTGEEVNTICHNVEDINAYQALVGERRNLMLWDNTIKFPPGWSNVLRVNAFASECAEFQASAWPAMHEFARGGAIINTYAPAEISKIGLMTAADYLWNPEQYDANDSLKRALYWYDLEQPELGGLVRQLANEKHQLILDQRAAFMKRPDEFKLNQIEVSIKEFQRSFESLRLVASDSLISDLEPYLRRHVDALPILKKIEQAFAMRKTAPHRAIVLFGEASDELGKLVDRLVRADARQPTNGCVKLVLEQKATNTIARWVRQVQGEPEAQPGD